MSGPARGRGIDPLGLWLCGLAALGLARAWLYLVRDAGTGGAVGWFWLGGSLLLGAIGAALLVRTFFSRAACGSARSRPPSPPR